VRPEQVRNSTQLLGHQWSSQVRDYEIDGYGGVNAAIYLNYMEEARKQFLYSLGFDYKAMAQRNLGFVVGRYEIDFVVSLVAGDEFVVETHMERVSRCRVEFHQLIYRLPGMELAVKCKNIGLPINIKRNRVEWPAELDVLLKDFPVLVMI
jgi:acyl-CoA thioester hydrolase